MATKLMNLLLICISCYVAFHFSCVAMKVPDRYFHLITKRRLCGDDLADALKFICNGVYRGPDKRQFQNKGKYYMHNDHRRGFDLVLRNFDNYLDEVVVTPKSVSVRQLYQQSGIVEECCRQTCTIYQLREYCGDQPSTESSDYSLNNV